MQPRAAYRKVTPGPATSFLFLAFMMGAITTIIPRGTRMTPGFSIMRRRIGGFWKPLSGIRQPSNNQQSRMKKCFWKNAVLFAISLLVVAANSLHAEKWKLVWSDEFDYQGLPDPAKWDYEQGFIRN